MIECFFDDSGKESQGDHRHVVMAGYLGHDQVWYPFAQRWRHLLMRHELPGLHMKTWVRTCQDKGWDRAKGNAVLGDFIQLIKESQLIGFGVAVDANVWRALEPKRRKAFGTAQEFCFQRVMRRIVDRMEAAGETDPLAVIFDRDFEFARPRLGLMEFLHKRDPKLGRRLAQFSFADSRFYYQLQAADLLAWETRRFLADRDSGWAPTERWKALFEALPYMDLDYAGEFWDAAEVEKYFPAIEAEWERQQAIAKLEASGRERPA